MTEFNLTTFSVIIYRLGIVASGTFIVYLGYKLFERSLFREGTHTDIDAVWGDRKLLIRRAAPGTLFAILGTAAICTSIFYGPSISFRESPSAIAPTSIEKSLEKEATLMPSSNPSDKTDSADNNKKEKRTSLEKERTVHMQEGKIPSTVVKEGDKTSSENPWESENPHSPVIEEPSTWSHTDKTVTTRKKQKSYKPRTMEHKTVFPSQSVESDIPFESEKEVDPIKPLKPSWKSEKEYLQWMKKSMGIEEEAEEPSNTPQSDDEP